MAAEQLLVGLDLGGTNIKGCVLDAHEGVVSESATVPTQAGNGPEAVVANLAQLGQSLLGDAAGPVGLGVPGLFDGESGTVHLLPNFPGSWAGYPLGETVSELLRRRVHVVNDARAFTLAEAELGAGAGADLLLGVTLGTGVGGGLVIDGRLHLGAFGTAGEFGHQIVCAGGKPCGCGNRGCVEAYARADVLCADAGRATASEVYRGAREGDPQCVAAVDAAADALAIGIANMVTVLGVATVVVGGGIASAADTLLDPLRRYLQRRLTMVSADGVEIMPAQLGSYAGAVGAALAARDARPAR